MVGINFIYFYVYMSWFIILNIVEILYLFVGQEWLEGILLWLKVEMCEFLIFIQFGIDFDVLELLF